MNNFRADLSDMSAKTATLQITPERGTLVVEPRRLHRRWQPPQHRPTRQGVVIEAREMHSLLSQERDQICEIFAFGPPRPEPLAPHLSHACVSTNAS